MSLRSRSVPGRTEAAQAFAVGAILITGIVLTATFLYLSINEPIVTKESEYQHAVDVAADFSALCTSITALGESAPAGASLAVPIRMGPAKESLIARLKESSGKISFSPTTEQVTVSVTDNGTNASAVWTDEDFTNTTCFKVIGSSGDIKLDEQPYARGYVESNLSNATGQIGWNTSTASTVYNNLSWNTSLPGDTRIVLRVRTDMFPDMRHATNWSACTPIESRNGHNTQNLSEISSVSPGHQYVQYRAELSTWDPSLTPTLLNVSISYYSPLEGVILARSSGAINFRSAYYYLPDNELMYEHGAVIKSQQEGDFTLENSGISAAKANSSTEIRASLFDLTGPPVPPPELVYSGPSTTLITVYRDDYEIISDSFYYPNLTLNITTEYPLAWSSWLNKTLKDARLTAGYDYAYESTTNPVRVVFYGREEGVKLYLDRATLQVRILKPT
jgi:hypothetical protein